MELSLPEQISQVIANSQSFLIALPETLTADTASAGVALQLYLEKMGKHVSVVSTGAALQNLGFLPGMANISSVLSSEGRLAVVVDTSVKKLAELQYETKENKVHVLLKANTGVFAPSDITFETSYSGIDCIFVLGTQNIEQLGTLFSAQAELFYELPKINIDASPTNEYFGTINLVDVTSVSVTEVLLDLFEQIGSVPLDAEIATALLVGIISNTNSFQSVATTPRVFGKASELIAKGARQQEIIQHVFKTKPLPLLKLWGRALARLKVREIEGLAYTILNGADFEKTDSTVSYAPLVLQEFLDNIAGFRMFAVFAEIPEGVQIYMSIFAQLNMELFFQALGIAPVHVKKLPSGVEYFSIMVPGVTLDIEAKFLEAIAKAVPTPQNNI